MVAVAGKVAVVTGGARGLGAALVDELLMRGVRTVHSTARTPHSDTRPAVVTHVLDVRSQDSVEALARSVPDARIVFNNAGIFVPEPLLTGDFGNAQDAFDVNVFGPLRVARAFAPVLRSNGGGAVVNMLSVMSWLAGGGAYGASKAAAWSTTNSLRVELESQNTHVVGVHAGFIDTDMAAGITMDKLSPAVAARLIVDGLEADADEVLTDEATIQAKAALAGPAAGLTLTL
ncbi:SDR family NAD(P)-dependent oxidoreductase [Mycolicibacterium sp. P1-18]|uniref:SDR family oxidoreductase n=1 Tax=Mycolicibacterium sp. P1-18 TaxID=2024615 RepID=UPI0011F24371|nr:SDR family oxidoreductase [Mycolicibacterium sp. P1-18]KAA0097955.1 SDR family NAD(P)-dependent oxidoreductase [Mycolicibacterium sp. P1-18]